MCPPRSPREHLHCEGHCFAFLGKLSLLLPIEQGHRLPRSRDESARRSQKFHLADDAPRTAYFDKMGIAVRTEERASIPGKRQNYLQSEPQESDTIDRDGDRIV
jgi:hypothetical protein